jgi:two-component system chemotaxis response regulator CheY
MTKLLIIDDEIKLRQTISELFSLSGYEVIEAQDGLEGLKKIKQMPVDLIICDVMMPKLDGYAFIEQLKKTNYANIPVLFLSAKTELSDKETAMNLGAKAYITKPFAFNELKSIVEAYTLK